MARIGFTSKNVLLLLYSGPLQAKPFTIKFSTARSTKPPRPPPSSGSPGQHYLAETNSGAGTATRVTDVSLNVAADNKNNSRVNVQGSVATDTAEMSQMINSA